MRFILSLGLLVLLTGCQHQPTKQGESIQFSDMQTATQRLADGLEAQGFVTKPINERQIEVFYGRHAFIMEPRIRPGGLSRVIVSQIYPVKPAYYNNPEVFVTLAHLNTHLSCAKYIMQPGNKVAEVQSSITFTDERLTLREVELFMAWMQGRIRDASSLLSNETLQMFEF